MPFDYLPSDFLQCCHALGMGKRGKIEIIGVVLTHFDDSNGFLHCQNLSLSSKEISVDLVFL